MGIGIGTGAGYGLELRGRRFGDAGGHSVGLWRGLAE